MRQPPERDSEEDDMEAWLHAIRLGTTQLGLKQWRNLKYHDAEEQYQNMLRAENPYKLDAHKDQAFATQAIQEAVKQHAQLIAQQTIDRAKSFRVVDKVCTRWRHLGALDTESYWIIVDSIGDIVKEIENDQ